MSKDSGLSTLTPGTRQHLEFSKLLVNTIQEYAMFLLDTEGNVVTWNPGAQKLKGYTSKEIIGKHFSVFYPKKDIVAGKPEWELDVCRESGHVEDEGWRIRKDGTKFWANVVITALRDDDGELIGFAKVTRDLSERKRHEEMLRKANRKLQQQSKLLQELNNAKDEFISLASHQLRTPASGVKQFLGLLLDGYAGELTDIQRDFVMRAYEGNNRQINLVNDLLSVAQVDAGKVVLKRSLTDLNELIRDVSSEQMDRFDHRKQKLKTNLQPTLPQLFIDRPRLRMAIENLIDNAGKYTPASGTITVSTKESDGNVTLLVADTGVGMDEAGMSKLFKKFSRIQNDLSDSAGGSGLGLYWAYKIVALHQGKISVSSKKGKGTEFSIVLPIGDGNA
jgi:PAS domain S-box-containing protein